MMISDLPNDLESEILSRVPAKSLTKLRTTCKRWYALFRDPSFVRKNLDKAALARELILHYNYDVHSISVNLHGTENSFDPSMEFTGKLRRLNDPKDLKISRIFHCHGLVLCSTIGNTRLVVWNPCTGQTRWIKPRTCYRCDDSYVLGYVNNKSSCDSRSYKILRFCRYYNDQKLRVAEFEMYEFSSDSWRVIDDITWGIFSDGVSLKGNTYWVAGEKETGFFLLNFDFTTERFSRLPLPYQSFHPDDIAVLSVVREEKLSLLNQNLHLRTSPSIKMNVWMTNKFDEAKDLSWSDFLVVDYDKFIISSGHVNSVISFVLDEETKVVLCSETDMSDKDRMRIYIIGEDIHKDVFKESTEGSCLNWPLLVSYVPNLVHIQKNTPKSTKKRKAKKARIGDQLCKKC